MTSTFLFSAIWAAIRAPGGSGLPAEPSRLLSRRVLRSVVPLVAGMTLCGSAVAAASGPPPQAGGSAAQPQHGTAGSGGQGQRQDANAEGATGPTGATG